MKQLGNLAITCARRRSVQMVVENGEVSVTIRNFPGAPTHHLRWDDDKKAGENIRELNCGKYREY